MTSLLSAELSVSFSSVAQTLLRFGTAIQAAQHLGDSGVPITASYPPRSLMSFEAIRWALAQPIRQSSAKFVLVALANNADENMSAWPSIQSVADVTGQDRKTVIANLARLIELGYVEDTGARKGGTGQVIVYRLKSPENGTVKESQKRNSSENGTVPNFLTNSPVFPCEQSRFSLETVPKTVHGTYQEPIKEPVIEPAKARERAPVSRVALPDWLPADVWKDWSDYRRGRKGAWTAKAQELSIRTMERLKAQGHQPRAVVDLAIERGWQGLFAPRDAPQAIPKVAANFQNSKYQGSTDDELPAFLRP